MKRRIYLFDVFNYTFMVIMMIVMLYPLLNVLAVSLSNASDINAGNVTWFPRGFNLAGYQYIIEDGQLFIGYKNTILYAAVGTVLTLTLTSLAAYVLCRKDLVGRKFFTIYWAITMFFGGGMIPTYLNIQRLGLMDTFLVMVLPGAVGAYTLFVFRSFMSALPGELRESAYIDGAGEWRVWAQVILPLSKPLLATYALFTIVGHWNSWFDAMLYVRDPKIQPVQLLIRNLMTASVSDTQNMNMTAFQKMTPEGLKMACVVVAMAPILCVYPFLQKYFIFGMYTGSVKG